MFKSRSLYAVWAIGFFLFLYGPQATWAQSESDWKSQWEETLAAAHKEGQVTVYGQSRYPVSVAIRAFEKDYPKIKFNFIGGRGSTLASKVMAENRAKKYLADIAIGGGATQVKVYFKAGLLSPMRTATILPENTDGSLWYQNKFHYADPEKRYVFMMRGDVSASMGAYNTNLVKPDEIQSWWDILDPKWKGKLVMTDPRSSGNVGRWTFLYFSPDLGPKFITRLLTEMDIRFSVDERQMIDWVASGKYPIHLVAKGSNVDNAARLGLPVASLFSKKEGGVISTGSHHMSFFKHSPHPNAAKVYINWALSKKGQTAWQKITATNSLRIDIPKDGVPSEVIPKEGKEYLMTSDPKYGDIRPLRKLVAKLLGKRQRQR